MPESGVKKYFCQSSIYHKFIMPAVRQLAQVYRSAI